MIESQIRPLRHSQIVQSRCTALITRNTNTGSRYRLSPPPPEITIQGISFERDQRYRRAYENGAEHCFRRSGGLRVPAKVGLLMRIWSALDVELKLAFESW